MSGPWPESTGLGDGAEGERRQRLRIWWRQAAGIFRSAGRARLRPELLAQRLVWMFLTQAVLAAVAAIALHQAGGPQGLARIPEQAGAITVGIAVVLLLIHAIARLGSVGPDVLRDVDEQVLEVYEASPLAGSAYVAGRTAFHLVEQGMGLAALLPSFALANAVQAFGLGDLLALALALFAVSSTYCLFVIGRVLGAHGRRARGVALLPGRRPGTGAVVAQALLGFASASVCYSFYSDGYDWVAPLLLAFALTPAMPVISASFDGLVVDFFGRSVGLWLPATLWLLMLAPYGWASARLHWKPPVRASGADLRLGFALAWLAPALALSGTLREGVADAAFAILLVAGVGALVLPAWAGAGELTDLGGRPGALRLGLLGARRVTAGPWALLVHGGVLLALGLLAPAVNRGSFLLLALVAWAGTAPILLVTAAAARWLGSKRRAAPVLFLLLGVVLVGGSALLPQLLSSLDRVPVLGALLRSIAGPVELLASASPLLLLPEAAHDILGPPLSASWLDLSPAWSLGLPAWGAGLVVQALVGLPLALLLNRLAARAGR